MIQFLINLFYSTSFELGSIFGIFFVLGFVLAELEKWTLSLYRRTIGWQGILFTAWLGTPFHELSHLLMAKLFNHHIIQVAFFKPKEATGELGYVNHSYNPKSIYQNLGNFFIGAAPTLLGVPALGLITYFVLPGGKELIHTLFAQPHILFNPEKSIFTLLAETSTQKNIHTISFWLFFYLSACISCHLAPSKPDRKTMRSGFIMVAFLLVFINLICLLLGFNTAQILGTVNTCLEMGALFFVFAIALSSVHLVAVGLLFSLYTVFFRRRFK